MDLVEVTTGIRNKLYLNDGYGSFRETEPSVLGSGPSYSVVLGDVDGDGGLDVIMGNHIANKLYLNDNGGFSAAGTDLGLSLIHI